MVHVKSLSLHTCSFDFLYQFFLLDIHYMCWKIHVIHVTVQVMYNQCRNKSYEFGICEKRTFSLLKLSAILCKKIKPTYWDSYFFCFFCCMIFDLPQLGLKCAWSFQLFRQNHKQMYILSIICQWHKNNLNICQDF